VVAAAQELVSLGHAASDTTSVVRGLLVISTCSEVLGLWRDAASTSAEIIRIGSPAQAQRARNTQISAAIYGDGTIRAIRDLIYREADLSGRSDRQGLWELVADALLAAAERSPDVHTVLGLAVARGDELYAAGRLTERTPSGLVDGFSMAGDLDGAIAYCQFVNDGFRRSGALSYASTYTLQQALLMLERGDSSETVAPLVDEGESWTSPHDAISVSYAAACRAILAVRSGDHARAERLADGAVRSVDRIQQEWQGADLRRWLSVVPRATGDHELERRMLLEAAQIYSRKEIRSYDAEISHRLTELDQTMTEEP
jgi:hypothetical protein